MDYSLLATNNSIATTEKSLNARGYKTFVVENKKEAFEKIKSLILSGSSVMNGSSVTLEQVGYIDYLKSGKSDWINNHEKVLAETDPQKQPQARKLATISDYYLGSVSALTEEGDFVLGSNTGSQIPSIVFNSENLIFVVSTKKIVKDLPEALKRLETYVVPLEDKHMTEKYGVGTHLNKLLIFKGESQYSKRKIVFILVKEDLGF